MQFKTDAYYTVKLKRDIYKALTKQIAKKLYH